MVSSPSLVIFSRHDNADGSNPANYRKKAATHSHTLASKSENVSIISLEYKASYSYSLVKEVSNIFGSLVECENDAYTVFKILSICNSYRLTRI